MQTLPQQIALIAVVVLGTMLTRFVPFLCFPAGRPLPQWVRFLGRNLPPAIFGLLVVYCLKAVSLTAAPYGIPELIGIAVTAIVHLAFRRMLLSMAAGTVVYMVIVNGLAGF